MDTKNYPFSFNLPNRYGDKIHLEKVDGNIYRLYGDLSYMSVTGDKDNIVAIDPSGGPYMSSGYNLGNGFLINKIIEKDNKFLFEIIKEDGVK